MTNLPNTNNQNLQFPATDMVYLFALDCAEHKINASCDNRCRTCASNIAHYVDDPRTAVMVQHAAELEVTHKHKLRHQERMNDLEYERASRTNSNSLGICAIVCASILILFVMLIVTMWKKPAEQVAYVSTEQAPSFVDDVPGIEAALRQVRAIDMDGDGKANCIDHTIQFYNAYPNKSQVRILWNKNLARDWNHLFVSVNGMQIEPGAYIIANNPGKKIRMVDIWPTYDDTDNRDITSALDYIIAGTYWIR